MAIVELEDVKAQLNQTQDVDDDLIERKIDAAQAHLESLLGFGIQETYTPSNVPDDLKECVCLLAAHWYENREAVLVGVNAQPLPMGVDQIVANHRNYSWGEPDAE